jgi:hypothetical protein
MFVHYFTHVPLNMSVVERRIDELRSSLDEWAGFAYREGEELRARVGPSTDGFAKEVRLEIGIPEIHRTGLVYALTWTAVGASALFPRLTGSLSLSHVGPDMTKIGLEGTYAPPLGPVGRAVDRIVLGKLADATVQNWVDRLADSVVSQSSLS